MADVPMSREAFFEMVHAMTDGIARRTRQPPLTNAEIEGLYEQHLKQCANEDRAA